MYPSSIPGPEIYVKDSPVTGTKGLMLRQNMSEPEKRGLVMLVFTRIRFQSHYFKT